MTRPRMPYVLVCAATVVLPVLLAGQERVDDRTIAAIKTEGFQRSHVMDTLSWLSDVHGPRLTNSKGYRAAAEWAKAQATTWGLSNAALEPWGTFGPGWEVQRFSIEMHAPRYTRIIAYPEAWTRSTPGTVTGSPVLVEIATKDDIPKYKGKLKGAIVLLNRPTAPVSRFTAPARRFTDEQLAARQGALHPGSPASFQEELAEFDKELALTKDVLAFLKDEGIAVLLEPSVRDGLSVEAASPGYYLSNDPPWFPAFVVAKEHYGRILRLLEKKIPVTLDISLETAFDRTDLQGYNVVAEIPGTDPGIGSELVMLGAHLDSWHAATGATDNGAGSAVVLEAMRILKAIGVKPRRTIRMALWGGEEQAFFGSIGYVKKHFGDPDTKALLPDQAKVAAYFNLDNGSGKIRGVYLQGNEAVRPIFDAWLAPFAYLGATTLTTANTSGTDHEIFDAVGIPAFQFLQDPLDYGSATHHTSLDGYEAAIADDLQQAAVVMASFAWHAAMRDEKLPREAMPPPVKPAP
ncbi:MAG: M20/M25/M40 family metallo-hydrolase [Vicinamibacterales bacterium]